MGISLSVATLIEESLALDRSGDIPEALDRALQAMELARSLDEPPALAAALAGLSKIRFRLGQYETAKALAEEALTLAALDAPARADALMMLGNCAAETDSLADAETFYRRAADLAREIGYTLVRFRALHNLGGVYWPRGQFDLALAVFEEAYRIAREHDLRDWIRFPLITIPWMYQLTGQPQRARSFLDELDQVAPPGSGARGYYYYVLATLALDEGDTEPAHPLYTQAISIGEAIGAPGLNVVARLGMSRYQRMTGNAPSAWNWADDAVTIADRTGYCHMHGKALIERGRAAWGIGDCIKAEADFRTAIEVLTPLQANFDLAQAYLLLAALRHEQGRIEADAAWLEAVSRIVSGGYAFLLERERALAFPLLAAYLNSDNPNVVSVSATLLRHLEHVPPPPLHIRTLGRFEVQRGRHPIPDRAWRRRRAGELFRLLIISPGRSLLRDQIAEALWPEKSLASTLALFHQATSALRRALEPDLPDKFPSRYLEVEERRATLRLPAGSQVDFERFEEHLQNEEWEAALELYQGELFPGDRYADWAAAPRERLMQRYLRAALAAARQRLEAGRPDKTLDACHRVLALEPWQEEAVLLGMQACVALNDRAGAHRLYLALERRLQEELGIAPQAAVRQFYRSLF